jgi:hypothetical protein
LNVEKKPSPGEAASLSRENHEENLEATGLQYSLGNKMVVADRSCSVMIQNTLLEVVK